MFWGFGRCFENGQVYEVVVRARSLGVDSSSIVRPGEMRWSNIQYSEVCKDWEEA